MTPAPPTSIIIPLDGSPLAETAIATGRRLAAAFGSGLVLVRATSQSDIGEADRYLREVAGGIDDRPVVTRTVEGDAGPALISFGQEVAGAALCLATRGHGGVVGERVLGSVASAIVRDADCPIVLVGPSTARRSQPGPSTGPIVLGFDGSPSARAVADLLVPWAGGLGLPVTVVTVLHHDGGYLGDVPSDAVRGAAGEVVDQLRSAGIGCDQLLVEGIDPARKLVQAAEELDASLLALGATAAGSSHGGARVVRATIGSTAERVVRHAGAPVLVARA